MACTEFLAPPVAMATTQFARNIGSHVSITRAVGTEQSTEPPAHELGRGHRQERRSRTAHALDR
jgi:hypothetical protein